MSLSTIRLNSKIKNKSHRTVQLTRPDNIVTDLKLVILEKTLIVYLVDGDVNKITSTFTNGQIDEKHFDTIEARIRAIDVLRSIFNTRHAEIKKLDEQIKKANVNKFTLGWFSRCNTATPHSKEGNTPLIQSSCV